VTEKATVAVLFRSRSSGPCKVGCTRRAVAGRFRSARQNKEHHLIVMPWNRMRTFLLVNYSFVELVRATHVALALLLRSFRIVADAAERSVSPISFRPELLI
jgi:hypothetical protein